MIRSSSSPDVEPLELVTHVRAKVVKELTGGRDKSRVNYDIEQNIREIKAILALNGEIFSRAVSPHMKQGAGQGGDLTFFERYAYDQVRGQQEQMVMWLVAVSKLSERAFDTKAMQKIPADLDDIVALKYKSEPFSIFIDYESFFENSLRLHEEILGPFLAKLKDHLMNVQVCLGDVDMWAVVDPQKNKNLLEASFSTELPESDQDRAVFLKNYTMSSLFNININSSAPPEHLNHQKTLLELHGSVQNDSMDFANQLKVGDFVDAPDSAGNWYEAVVRQVTPCTIRVHYFGWGLKWDAVWGRQIKSSPPQPLWSKTKRWREEIKRGDRVDVREVNSAARKPKWYSATVLDVGNEEDAPRALSFGAELESNEVPLLLMGRKKQVQVLVPSEWQESARLRWVNLYGEEICQANTHSRAQLQDIRNVEGLVGAWRHGRAQAQLRNMDALDVVGRGPA